MLNGRLAVGSKEKQGSLVAPRRTEVIRVESRSRVSAESDLLGSSCLRSRSPPDDMVTAHLLAGGHCMKEAVILSRHDPWHARCSLPVFCWGIKRMRRGRVGIIYVSYDSAEMSSRILRALRAAGIASVDILTVTDRDSAVGESPSSRHIEVRVHDRRQRKLVCALLLGCFQEAT